MTLAAILQQALSDELCRQGQTGLIVWYDPGGTLRAVVGRAMPEGAKLLSFEGSYLALRFALETEDPHFQKRWVVYIPEAPLQESWLRDWELLGTRWEMDLLELLHRQVNLPPTPRLSELLRRYPENARDLAQAWESLIGGQAINETTLVDALLALGFGLPRWQMEEAILLFVSGTVGQHSLSMRGLWTAFCERVAEWTGWEEIPDEEETLRKRLEAAALLSELVNALPELSRRFAEVLPAEPKRPLAASLARTWRDRENLRDAYLRSAQRVEREYELSTILTAHEALLNLDTFPIVDDFWWQEVQNVVAPDGSNFKEKAPRVAELARQRSSLFWAKQGWAAYWRPVTLATRLVQECQEATKEAENFSDVAAFVSRYTEDSGWWQMDLWALELAAEAQKLSIDERKRFVFPAWRAYGAYLDYVNRRFAETVEREGWNPTQTGFWNQLGNIGARTAVFLVDALRYDLAQRLISLLAEEEFKATLEAIPAMLPTVTEVGMAALLPGAEVGIQVNAEKGTLQVQLNNVEVGSYKARQRWLENQLGPQGLVVKLEELGQTSVENTDVVVVTTREIDEFGTSAVDLNPEGLLERVDQLVRGIRYLSKQGFERFLVTADHGFLFLPQEIEVQRLKAPTAKVCKHRFAVGGGSSSGCLIKRADELKLGGSEVFSFPTGLAVFALPGETGAFLHGGISLQESIVPVVTINVESGWQKVEVIMDLPTELTSRIASIRIQVKNANLFRRSRKVVVEINGRQSEPVELMIGQQEKRVRLTWLDFTESPPEHAMVRLIDADSGQVLQEVSLPVKMVL